MSETKKQTMINDLTSGSVARQLVKFAFPFMLSNLLQTLYTMVDMIVIGRFVGNSGLSAVSVGGDIAMFFMWVGMGFSGAGQILISQYVGRKDTAAVSRTIGTMFSSISLLAVILTVVNLALTGVYLDLMNTPPEALSQARDYSMVCFGGLFFIFGYNTVSAILRGMGDSRRPFVFVAVAALMNVVLDLIFVALFHMDAMGAALATVMSQGFSFAGSLVYLYLKREAFGFDFRPASFKIDPGILKSLVRLGVPMALQSAAISISAMFVHSIVNVYGVVASAVTGVGNKLMSLCSVITNSMYTASGSMIGQNLGAGRHDRVTRIVWTNLTINLCAVTVLCILCKLFPTQLFSIFNTDPEVLAWAPVYANALVISYLASATMSPFNALVSGIGFASLHFVIGLLDGVVARIGLSLLMGNVMGMGIEGFWYGSALAGFVTSILAGAYYFSGKWKTRKLIIEK